MKYKSIQLLRGVAALMVVMQHSHIAFSPVEKTQLWWWPGFSDFGYLGVSVFFVISGFIIAQVLSAKDFSLRDYLWHRFMRIYPLYWIVMAVGFYYYYTRNWFKYGVDSLGAVGLIKSFLIFPLEGHPFWEPGWSLEHEVIFYAIAAVVAPVLGLWRLGGIMIALGTTGMFFQLGWDYHLFSEVQIFFGAGIVAYLLKDHAWRASIPVAVVTLALAYGQYYGAFEIGTKFASVAYAIGVAALIIGLVDIEKRGLNIWTFFVLLGNVSFSLYLWHWLIIPLASRWRVVGGEPELWRWIIIAVSIFAAVISYFAIEKPLIYFSHRKRASIPN